MWIIVGALAGLAFEIVIRRQNRVDAEIEALAIHTQMSKCQRCGRYHASATIDRTVH